MSEKQTLFYIHDPMCSWCWGYRPTWQLLKSKLPESVCVNYVLGGLAPDTDQPMPQELQHTIQGHWQRIATELGTEFNFEFWKKCKPRRSTYPACRAVIPAKNQDSEMQMIAAIQRAYYLRAMNPSDISTLTILASELELDEKKFADDITSLQTEQELQRQIQFVRDTPNRGFPGLLLKQNKTLIPVDVNYKDAQPTLTAIEAYIKAVN